MRQLFIGIIVGVMAGCAHAGSAPSTEPEAGGRVALIKVGNIDEGLMTRLHKHMEQGLMLRVEDVSVDIDGEASLDAVANTLSKKLGPTHAFGVAIYAHDQGEMAHGVVVKDARIAVVNANAMQAESGDAEVYARRLERQVIRGVCFLLGLSYSPNMRSAMYNYENFEELDMMGRNLDPPWLIQVERAAREQGLDIISFQEAYQQGVPALP